MDGYCTESVHISFSKLFLFLSHGAKASRTSASPSYSKTSELNDTLDVQLDNALVISHIIQARLSKLLSLVERHLGTLLSDGMQAVSLSA